MIGGSSVHGRDRRWLHRKWAPGVGGRSRQAWYQGWRDPSHRGVILCRSVDPAGKSGGAGAHGEAAKQPPRWAGVPDNHSLATLPRTRGTIPNTMLFPPRPRDLAGHWWWLSEVHQRLPAPAQDPETWQVTGGGSQRLNTQHPDPQTRLPPPRTQDSYVYASTWPFLAT